MATKIPKEYSPVEFEKIVRDLEKQIADLKTALKLKRLKSVSADAAPSLGIGDSGYVLDDNQNFDYVVRAEDGRLYRIGGLAAGSSDTVDSGGTLDHGSLTGLTDDDHSQYVLRSILTTKGDLFAYGTAVTRLAVGSDGQIIIPDSPSTTGIKWGNLVFSDDELISNNDEIVTV